MEGQIFEEDKTYGVRISFEVPDSSSDSIGTLPFEGELTGENFCVLTERDVKIRVAPFGDTLFDVYLESFRNTDEAESFGNLFVQALLWGSLSGPSVRIREQKEYPNANAPNYSKGPLLIYDSRHEEIEKVISRSFTIDLSVSTPMKGQTFFVAVSGFLNREGKLNQRIETSLEIYASASHEKTARAHFVSMVSALEPLIKREPYTSLGRYSEHQEEVEETIDELLNVIRRAESEKDGLPGPLLNSWRNRIKDKLRSESIGQALKRMVRERLPDVEEAPKIIRAAYNLRSRILHDGVKIEEDDRRIMAKSKRLIPMIIATFIDKEAYSRDRSRQHDEGVPSV